MEEKRKKFGIELLPSLHKALREMALARDGKLYEVMQEAVEEYLGVGKEKGPGPEASVPPRYRPCLRMLAEILSSGDEVVIEAAVLSLRAWQQALRPRTGGRKEH